MTDQSRYLAAMLALAAGAADAQTYAFDPASPNPGEAITVTAVWPNSGNFVSSQGYLTSGAPDGGTINVWFVQDGGNFSPNPPTILASQTIAGLSAGTYVVNITWVADPSSGPSSQQTFHLRVGAGTAPPFAIDPSVTGSWYDPSEPGHGFSIEVLPDNQLLAYWYVYAPPPQGGQAWVVATGSYSGNTASLAAYWDVGSGALFPPAFNPDTIHAQQWGTITFTFTGCNSGTASWQPAIPGYTAGSVPITRLTLPAGLTCAVTIP